MLAEAGVVLRLRVVNQPERLLAMLLDRLGMVLPGRPKMISNIVQNLTPLDPNSLGNDGIQSRNCGTWDTVATSHERRIE